MSSNFEFLNDKKLFKIIHEAEKLYKDGYFEQTIVQTRKFGEAICKQTLGVRCTMENTFDEMLATLEDILTKTPDEKEFIDDLYFLKKQGNLAAHNSAKELNTIDALECLKRAFEIAIKYAQKNNSAPKKDLNFSLDLIMADDKKNFSEEYKKAKIKIPPDDTIVQKNKPTHKKAEKKQNIQKNEVKKNKIALRQEKCNKTSAASGINQRGEFCIYIATVLIFVFMFVGLMFFILPR